MILGLIMETIFYHDFKKNSNRNSKKTNFFTEKQPQKDFLYLKYWN